MSSPDRFGKQRFIQRRQTFVDLADLLWINVHSHDVEAAGSQVVAVANKAEFVEAMKPVYERFANSPRLKDLVKRIQDGAPSQ